MHMYGPFCNSICQFYEAGNLEKCDLDNILMKGGQLYKSLDRTEYLNVNNLMENIISTNMAP